MNIGFVSVWGERGAAYVTRAYINLLQEEHNVFVYARGSIHTDSEYKKNWGYTYVTEGLKLNGTKINWRHFKKWIKKNKIEKIFFNEQREIDILIKIRKYFPEVQIGSYIDYYKEDSVSTFKLYDYLICNTKRHYSVFSWHPNCYFVPWGTDINLYNKSRKRISNEEIVFFHSAGLSTRKGTSTLYKAFVQGDLYKRSKLIIHTQQNVREYGFTEREAEKYNIEIIEKSVTAPGLYKLGDVYVYPTMLDGLGLTVFEALSSGLPVITSDEPPMNEIVNNDIGRLVEIEMKRSRRDAYYWPLVECNLQSLISSMKYYIDNIDMLPKYKEAARNYAEKHLNWKDRRKEISDIFLQNDKLDVDIEIYQKSYKNVVISSLISIIPDRVLDLFNKYLHHKNSNKMDN